MDEKGKWERQGENRIREKKQMEKQNFPLACWAPIPTQVFLGLEERAENGWSGLMKIGAGRIRHSTVAVVSLMGK